MSGQTTDQDRLKKGTAVLVACVVQTLHESDPTFQGRFLANLSKAYDQIKDDWDGDVSSELELLAWTKELLTGRSFGGGQGKPFFEE